MYTPEAWKTAMDDEFMKLVAAGETEAARERLRELLREQGGEPLPEKLREYDRSKEDPSLMKDAMVQAVQVSHKTAPVEARERLALSSAELPAMLNLVEIDSALGTHSTCNRTELYVSGHVRQRNQASCCGARGV